MTHARLLAPLFPLLLTLACVGDKSPSEDTAVDLDGDGVNAEDDCDDDNPAVFPGATETCDGLDNNCDGAVDEGGLLSFYPDGDGDGFGVEAGAIEACEAPTGYADQPGDCDDSAATTYPDAAEVCDGLDNNCDGAIDEGALITFYLDEDGDGYGLAETQACEAPSGAVALGGDCDDADPSLTPEDYDADGLSSCDGDCDDSNVNLTDRCSYSTMDGVFEVPFGGCVFDVEGVDADGSTLCPACDFSFETFGALVAGDCLESFDAMLGYDRALGALSFQLYLGPGYYYNVGKFPASVNYGADYDVLNFSGYGVSGYAYSGSLNLRP